VNDLPRMLRPAADGGVLEHAGTVEVISSLNRDGSEVERDLRWGVYVTFEGGSDYTRRCIGEYGLVTDPTGRYSALYRPFHLIGLELGISIASVVLRGEPTGAPEAFLGDVVATAKRDLAAGERLDGEGGFTVFGRLMPAQDSVAMGGLPLGLAEGVALARGIAAGSVVHWRDVRIDAAREVVRVRRDMESEFITARDPVESEAAG
jgi:predicted homoserine dehydrogenase-like protein